MKFRLLLVLFTLVANYAVAQKSDATAQTYPQLIMKGDYADPSIMREGADYYMTHSPFYYAPGFLIWHSLDLVHWEPVCRALPHLQGSAWAPDLLKYKGRYYIYYPADETNWVTWADDIRGPWSEPIDLKVEGIDPGHLADAEGNRYLFLNGGSVIRLSEDGLSTVGEKMSVYGGWEYPSDWETECMCLESPKMNYKDGYYYMTSAEGGTAGPATSHMAVSARAKHPLGPWENSPYNPIVHTYSDRESWWSKGHGTLIDDVNGNWWIVYHAYAKGYYSLGRQTLIEPIEWTPDGWFRTKSTAQPIRPKQQIAHGMRLSDDFLTPQMGLQWTFWKENAPEALTIGGGTLQMEAKGTSPADARLLLVTAEDTAYVTQVQVETAPGNCAGLMLFYSEAAFAGVTSDGDIFTVHLDGKSSFTLPNTFGKRFVARITNRANRMTVQVSKNGKKWQTLAGDVDISQLHHNVYGGFLALRVALLSAGEGSARFKAFRYTVPNAILKMGADELYDTRKKK